MAGKPKRRVKTTRSQLVDLRKRVEGIRSRTRDVELLHNRLDKIIGSMQVNYYWLLERIQKLEAQNGSEESEGVSGQEKAERGGPDKAE